MRRIQTKWSYYLLFIIFLTLLWNFPLPLVQKARFSCVGAALPSLKICYFFTQKVASLFAFSSSNPETTEKEVETLRRENHLLRLQLENMKEWFFHEDRMEHQINRWKELYAKQKEDGDGLEFYQRRQKQLKKILQLEWKAIPAKVIYREPVLWSSVLWVNVGEKENQSLGETIVAKNSPVVIGNIIVGIIEEVGKTRSKVRLITDAKLTPAVRALRGKEQNRVFVQQVDLLLQMLQTRQDLFSSQQELTHICTDLHQLKTKMEYGIEDAYLAKGEIYGGSFPLWRARGQFLTGIGFNYDFPDEEGPSPYLRLGRPSLYKEEEKVALVQEGDLLITSGLDGIFIPGLVVGVVNRVGRLQEGNSHYELTALSLIPNLHDLQTVFILPPLEE